MNVKKLVVDEIKEQLKIGNIEKYLEVPPSPELGDLAFTVFHLAKKMKKPPHEISKKLAKKIKPSPDSFISKVEARGGYVNVFYNYEKIANLVLGEIDESYGSSSIGKGTRVMVEHTSVNPNKAYHIGHTRNSSLGDSLAKIKSAVLNLI